MEYLAAARKAGLGLDQFNEILVGQGNNATAGRLGISTNLLQDCFDGISHPAFANMVGVPWLSFNPLLADLGPKGRIGLLLGVLFSK